MAYPSLQDLKGTAPDLVVKPNTAFIGGSDGIRIASYELNRRIYLLEAVLGKAENRAARRNRQPGQKSIVLEAFSSPIPRLQKNSVM